MSDGEEEQNEDQKKPLLTLAIELGDKKKRLLNIYLDSKPEQLAYDFCLQNNLDFDSMQNLTEEIKNALSSYNPQSQNKENKNQISEEPEQNTSNKKREKEEENEEENEVNNENENNRENENENESEHKTEELNEDNNQEEQEIQNNEINENKEDIEKDNESEEKEENDEKEEKEENDEKGEKEEEINIQKKEKEEKEENNIDKEDREENKEEEVNKEEEKEKEESNKESSKKEEAEEELKEEERDKVIEQNTSKENKSLEKEANEENEEDEDEEDIPSYLSPTICFQNKQRQIVQSKPKQEFKDFDTSYKKYDKNTALTKELNEEVVNHLTININNQKYLPRDYYDNPENQNFGERLYNREKIMKESAMEKAKQKAKNANIINEKNMTFIPKINDYNLIALQNRRINKTQYNDENRILNYKDYLKEKENKTRKKHYEDIEKENTFTPKIDKNSEKMAGNRSLQIPRYEQLFKKKKDLKQLEKKIYNDKNLFKPTINKEYKGIKDKDNKMNEYSNLTFEERQKRFKQRMEENKEKLNEIKNANVDQRTGKKYFKPTINKNKKLEEERKNKKVFNELYRDSTKYKIKKEELVKKISELEKGLY